MKKHFKLLMGAVLLSVASSGALAQAYPNKPIRFVLSSAPGGAGDVIMRTIGQQMEARMGQPVVLDHRPGAGGVIGMQSVARAPADGYTILMGYIGVAAVNQFIYTPPPYDTMRDFVPVSLVATFPNVLSVRTDLPVKNVKELIAYAKANPGKLNYGSAGTATSPHLTTELFKNRVGIDMLHIPFKGAGPAMIDFLAGRIDVMFDNLVTAKQHIDKGRFRILGITTAKRSPLAPELPTVSEEGVEGFESVGWFGVLAPAGLPQPILDKLSTEIASIMKMPEVQKALRDRGMDPVSSTAPEFKKFLEAEIDKWGRVVKAANIKAS